MRYINTCRAIFLSYFIFSGSSISLSISNNLSIGWFYFCQSIIFIDTIFLFNQTILIWFNINTNNCCHFILTFSLSNFWISNFCLRNIFYILRFYCKTITILITYFIINILCNFTTLFNIWMVIYILSNRCLFFSICNFITIKITFYTVSIYFIICSKKSYRNCG